MHENQNTEFKSSWREEYIRYISAFSNSEGGFLYLGVNDEGEVIGLDNAEKLLETLPNLINQKTGILPVVKIRDEGGKRYIILTVHPSIVPISYHGHYYIRSGSVTTELQGPQLSEFLLKKHGVTWEEIEVDDFTEEELDLETIERFKILARDRLPYVKEEKSKMILQKLNLIKGDKYKRAAVLLFAKNPQKYFLQARIRIGKFLNEAEILTSDIVEGNLFRQVDLSLDILRTKYLLSPISYEGIYRREKLEYPYEALREAVLNAVIHRDYMITSNIQIRVYPDKLEIMNDGKLPGEITVEDLKNVHNSIPRNFLIADTFYKSGQIENWGRGTIRIIKECVDNGLPQPLFYVNKHLFTVRLLLNRTDKVTDKVTGKVTDKVTDSLSEKQKKIMSLLRENNRMTLSDLSEALGISRRKIVDHTNKLKEKGVLMRVGNNKSGYWQVIMSSE